MTIKASCTWGDGPDIMLVIEGEDENDDNNNRFILYEDPKHQLPPRADYIHGYVTNGSMDLTANEARILAARLEELVKQVDGLNYGSISYQK